MKKLEKRSFRLAGHATSIALEPEFWQAFEQQAARHSKSLSELVGEIDASRTRNLASEIRVYVLAQLQGADLLLPVAG